MHLTALTVEQARDHAAFNCSKDQDYSAPAFVETSALNHRKFVAIQ